MVSGKGNDVQVKNTNRGISVIDCPEYIRPPETTSTKFANKSKSINEIDVSFSHNVAEHYIYKG